MKEITTKSFEDAVVALLKANPRNSNKGKALKEWFKDSFNIGATVSHIKEDKQIGNRVAEQFKHKLPIVVFVCDKDVSQTTLISKVKEQFYLKLNIVVIMGDVEPFDYNYLFVRKQNDFSDWAQNNLGLEISDMDWTDNPLAEGSNDYIRHHTFIAALHTKPFLLLAGISGTGKSQKVQELAFMSCPEELRNEEGTTPKNYCLIEVKPNWHDSSELLGYYSALTGKYELTDFVRFAYRAVKFPQYPFFLCLDEMNLAPVEQYFAEFLSVLETRKTVDGIILSQPLLKKEKFANCELEREIEHFHEGFVTDGQQTQKKPIYSQEDSEIIKYLKENGLLLPSNLFVIGTVNMDDTTHQFSRKVIDRAFTIEMNGGKMAEMFSQESRNLLEYREEPVPLSVFQSEFVRAYEVLEDSRFSQYEDIIVKRIPEILGDPDGDVSKDSINGILHTTPFRVSYRVQNELVLYLSVLIEQADYPDDIEPLIKEATLAILMEKILPRVQGEKKQLETTNGSDVLKDMKTFVEMHFAPEEGHDSTMFNKVIKKLDEMEKRLDSYYTNFF